MLKAQAARYPEMQVQDCYKLVYQACLGSEHAVGDPALAARWLERELATMGPGPAEPAVDPIAPDGGVVRVHLRPYLARGGEAGKLAAAFVETAAKIHGSREKLAEAWAQVVELARAGQLPFPAEAAENFWRQIVQADYPAVHHSARFNECYRPAYRVVAGELARGLLPAQ